MKLWSRGLGPRELVMDFTHYAVRRSDDGGIEIFGVTEQPVSWEFRVHIGEEDIPGIASSSQPLRLGYFRPNDLCSRVETPIPGLLVAGASVHHGGMILGGPGYLGAKVAMDIRGLSA